MADAANGGFVSKVIGGKTRWRAYKTRKRLDEAIARAEEGASR